MYNFPLVYLVNIHLFTSIELPKKFESFEELI